MSKENYLSVNKADFESLLSFAETDVTREALRDEIRKLNIPKEYLKIKKVDYESLLTYAETDVRREALSDELKKLNISKEDKAALYELSGAEINWKKKMVNIGIRIVEITLNVVRRYPATCAAAIIGLALYLLFSAVPIIGSFVGLVLALILIGLGLMSDLGYQVRDILLAETRNYQF